MIKNSNGYLESYYHDCKSGKFIIGHELMLTLDQLMVDLVSDEYVYDTTYADMLINFMEGCIRLTKSPFYGKPMILMSWQKAWISALYGFQMYEKELGKYVGRFTETLLLIGRKNAKSETTSALILAEMLAAGEGKDLVCASNTYEQSGILYEAVDTMRVMIDPQSKDTWRNRKGLKCLYNNNKLFMMSDRTTGKEGRNIDMAAVDEMHEMKDNTLIKPIEQSMSIKEEKKLILITTNGFVNDGELDDRLKKYRAIIYGEDTGFASRRKLPWLYTQDSESEVWETDENGINQAWQKSNPSLVYGVKKWAFLRDSVEDAKKSKQDRMFVLSKDFNFKVSNSEAWLMREDYDYDAPFDIEDFRGAVCLGSVDLSETTDLCSAKIMLLKPNDRRKYIFSHYWIPESKLTDAPDESSGAKYHEWANNDLMTIVEGNDIDLSVVADWFYSLKEKYDIQLLYCGYDQRFKRDWQNKMEYYGWMDKQELIMIYQRPDVLNSPIKQVEADLKDRLIIGLNEIDKWCLGNSELKLDARGKGLLVKISGQQSRRIDGAVTLVMLQEMFNRYKVELTNYFQ